MENEFKTFDFKLDTLTDTGVFTGYAATFGNVDLGGDVVDKGAFKKSLRESKGKFPILHHHDPTQQIGWNLEASEDGVGLLVKGQLDLNVALAKERYSLMKMGKEIGADTGLSIGFRTIKEMPDKVDPHIRHLKEVQLMEYSVVTFPMNELAGVTDVKQQKEIIIQTLSTLPGFDREKANKGVELLLPLLESEPDQQGHSDFKEAGEIDLEPLKHSLKELINTIKNN